MTPCNNFIITNHHRSNRNLIFLKSIKGFLQSFLHKMLIAVNRMQDYLFLGLCIFCCSSEVLGLTPFFSLGTFKIKFLPVSFSLIFTVAMIAAAIGCHLAITGWAQLKLKIKTLLKSVLLTTVFTTAY